MGDRVARRSGITSPVPPRGGRNWSGPDPHCGGLLKYDGGRRCSAMAPISYRLVSCPWSDGGRVSYPPLRTEGEHGYHPRLARRGIIGGRLGGLGLPAPGSSSIPDQKISD